MTEQQKQQSIAEWMGWINLGLCTCSQNKLSGLRPEGNALEHIPDYFHDLNAIHEAEEHLGEDQYHRYLFYLRDLGYCATASQRAEALFQTIQETKQPSA